MTNVLIVSGFLGAGKTTLIKKLLKESMRAEKCVLLENEYGEIGIDGGFMKDSGIQVTELNSGCICCTLVGDFEAAIDEIVNKFSPDRLIIEPSGVGKLSDIRRVVEAHAREHGNIRLSGCVTVVDASKCRMYIKNFGEFFIDQVKCAETIILSRTQLAGHAALDKSVQLVREQNADARVITTPWDELSGDTILGAIESPKALINVDEIIPRHAHHHHHGKHEHGEHCEHEHHEHCEHEHHEHCEHEHHEHCEHEHEHCEHEHHEHGEECACGCGHDEHDADEVFDNLGVETVRVFERRELEDMLCALEDERRFGMVIRAKGIVESTDGKWLLFDYVPGETEIRTSSADYTGRLCVIGTKLNQDALRALFGV